MTMTVDDMVGSVCRAAIGLILVAGALAPEIEKKDEKRKQKEQQRKIDRIFWKG